MRITRFGSGTRCWSQNLAQACRRALIAAIVAVTAFGGTALLAPLRAHAVPAPEVEYLYDVSVRRQYGFPNNDPIGYGHAICDKFGQGEGYPQVMDEVRNDITPKDEFAVNYLVSYAVSVLCPPLIDQMRRTAAGYVPPGPPGGDTYY